MSNNESLQIPVVRDGVIHCDGVEYHPWWGGDDEEFYPRKHIRKLPEPKPGGDQPLANCGCFFWRDMAFLPKKFNGSDFKAGEIARAIVRDGQKQARRGRRADRFAPTIPPELEPEIADRHANNWSLQEIADWLDAERNIRTSHASVGRAVKRYHRTLLVAQGASDTMQRIQDRREDMDRVLEDMDRLRQCAIDDLLAGDELDPAIEVSFRMARQEAMAIQHDLREAGRFLATEQRDAVRAERLLSKESHPGPSEPPQESVPRRYAPPPPRSEPATSGLASFVVALFITFGSWPSAALAKTPSYAPERVRAAVPDLLAVPPEGVGKAVVERAGRRPCRGGLCQRSPAASARTRTDHGVPDLLNRSALDAYLWRC